jgi:hypothetical protein
MSVFQLSWQNIVIGDPKTSIIIDNTAFISDQIPNDNINIYPNPFNSEISIRFQIQNLKQVTLTIKNVLGQTLLRHVGGTPSPSGRAGVGLDLSFLSKGIYLLDILIDGERTVKKIVKE